MEALAAYDTSSSDHSSESSSSSRRSKRLGGGGGALANPKQWERFAAVDDHRSFRNADDGHRGKASRGVATTPLCVVQLPPPTLAVCWTAKEEEDDDDDARTNATAATAAASMIHWPTDYLFLKQQQQQPSHRAVAVIASTKLNEMSSWHSCYAEQLVQQHDFYARRGCTNYTTFRQTADTLINDERIVRTGNLSSSVHIEKWESIDQLIISEEQAWIHPPQQN